MNKNVKAELDLYLDDSDVWDDPELEDSTYNPANDEFKKTLGSIQRRIKVLTLNMRPRDAVIVKVHMTEGVYTKTAKRLKVSPETVKKVWVSRKGVELRGLIQQHNTLMAGTNAIEREQLLWRIALDNEHHNPRTSVSAIAEINKMKADTEADHAKIEQEKSITDKPQVIIQLGDNRLLPSPLDVN